MLSIDLIPVDLLPILCLFFSFFLIYGPELYYKTNKMIYLIITIITTNLLIYVIYKMFYYKYSLIVTSIVGKILPTLILSFISFFILKETKVTYIKIIAIGLVLIGTLILVKE